MGGYRLTARRYGHGVGMSQRGAQQMASEGLTYDQILQFYYPGLVRTRYTMTRTILPSIDGTGNAGGEPVADAKSAVVTLQNPLVLSLAATGGQRQNQRKAKNNGCQFLHFRSPF